MYNHHMKIHFLPSSDQVELFVDRPEPAIKNIPEWYTSSPKPDLDNIIIDPNTRSQSNPVIKQCAPFFDAISFGYIQKTWCDIQIKVDNNTISIISATEPDVVGARAGNNIPIDNQYYPIEFVWKQPWIPKTPNGYSYLITHPLNSINLPFTTLSAVVDGDNFYHQLFGNIPFYVKSNFSGIIKTGTPMYQIIPFKRDDWESRCEHFNPDEATKNLQYTKRNFVMGYKNNFWQKKKFK